MTTALGYHEACDQVCGTDSMFELVDAEIRGRTYKVFKHAPPNVGALCAMSAARGDTTFLVYEDETYSYADVVDGANAVAASLQNTFGVQKGDRVAIAMRNFPEWITSVLGVMSIGAVATTLNAWWGTDELAYGISDSGAKVVVADTRRMEAILPKREELGVEIIVARHRGDAPDGVTKYEDAVADAGDPSPVDVDVDDDAMIMYTSGTTGFPKGAVNTHRCIISALMGYAARGEVERVRAVSAMEADGVEPPAPSGNLPVFILTVPLFHITGFLPVMMGSFLGGAKLVMMYKWDPKRALELIEREKVTQFVGVPTMVQDLLEVPEFDRFDTSSLKSIGGGGAAAAPELVKRVADTFKGGAPGIGYGMTETTAYGPQNAGSDYIDKPKSAGRAIPMLQVAIKDPAGDDVPQGEQGEICFYGPNVIRAYWNKPEATEEAFIDGWLRSGDLGRIDEEGFVFIEDRAKDMVIRAGENIGCIEVEAAISAHEAVYECTVFGVPHERLGEELACSVYLKDGASLTAEELQAFVGERLAKFKVPSIVIFRQAMLPRSPQGKILKRVVRDEVSEQMANS